MSCAIIAGTVTGIDIIGPVAGITVSGGPVITSGIFTLTLADDLAALEALTGTDTIYYRSGVSTWMAVTIGSGLLFTSGTLTASGGGAGDVVGPASAVNSGVALFDGVTGKLIKDGGVLGTLATQSGTFSGTSSGTNTGDQTNVSGNAATVTTNANLTGPVTSVGNATTIAAGVVTEAMQVLADNTTQDVSTAKHGYAPKAPNDATKFLNGLGAYAVPAGSGMSNTIILEDQKTSGTDGGTFISGAWRTRDLNTEVADTGGDCTLASNQFTLVAGTYELIASAPGYIVTYHQARLQNITDATTIASGTSEYTYGSYFTNNRSIINTRFTIASSTAFEIQHRCGATAATNGFGVGSGASFTVAHETYTQVWIKRVA